MNNVVLQPCSSPEAAQHFSETVSSGVPLEEVLAHVDQQVAEDLQSIYPQGHCSVWGTTPNNGSRWDNMNEGDVVLFTANRKVTSTANVTYRIHNSSLASALWGLDEEGQAWEYIYFLNEVKLANISFDDLFPVIGYPNPRYQIRRLQPLAPEKSENFFAHFGRQSGLYFHTLAPRDREKIVTYLASLSTTDAPSVSTRRLEQRTLKNWLLNHRTVADCAICGKHYPSPFLVAAHIKRRSECNEEERRDPDVVVLMCKFGCDDLFERGYIAVQDHEVVSLKKKPTNAEIKVRIAALVGKPCHYFTPSRAKYFNEHFRKHTAKRS